MSITEAERKSADYHAGPHGSFPVNDDGGHFAAAWHLAETGHGDNPKQILAHLRSFAEKHGLTHMIPKSQNVQKATGGELRDLYQHAWNHERMEGDRTQQRELVQFAAAHGHQQYLPPEAHSAMHEVNVPHNHEGIENDQNGMHEHVVTKAFNAGEIAKSWVGEDGYAYYEGWLSTPHKDREKDITEPTAFVNPMDDYFRRRAPVSIEHNGRTIPIGHLQKAAVIVDGKVVKSASHPTDPAEFEHLPTSGSGVWSRGVANEEPGISALRKGNVGGQSFIATAKAEALPGGRYRYVDFDPWMESTIAAYPINPQAVIAVVKAFGAQEKDTTNMALKDILEDAAAKVEAQKADAKKAETEAVVTKAELGTMLIEFKDLMLGEFKSNIDEQIAEIKKATSVPARGEGVGRKGTAPETNLRDENPLAYLESVVKASKGEDDAIDGADKELIGAMTHAWLTMGMPEFIGQEE